MKALISPQESNRIAEVKANNNVFPIALPLYWIDCPDECTTEWTFNGGEFAAPVIPEPVFVIPTTVSMRQARLALLQQDLLATVDAAVAASSEADKIAWEYATEVNRNDAMVQNFASALGFTSQDLDNLFLLASGI